MVSTIGFTGILHEKIASNVNDKIIPRMLVVNDFTTTFDDRSRFIFSFFSVI